jgi:hypothetical protein
LFDIVDNEVNDSPDKKSIFSIFIGCTTSAPDGSSPRGYRRIFLSIGSKILSSLSSSSSCFYFIGCATSAPDGSSPRGYKGVLAAFYRLNKSNIFFTHLFFPFGTPWINFPSLFFTLAPHDFSRQPFSFFLLSFFTYLTESLGLFFIWTFNLQRPIKDSL